MPLTGVPLTGASFTGVPLTGMPFTGVSLTGVSLIGVLLTGVPLTGVPLTGVHLTDVPFTGMPLTGLHLTGVHRTGVHLSLACISHITRRAPLCLSHCGEKGVARNGCLERVVPESVTTHAYVTGESTPPLEASLPAFVAFCSQVTRLHIAEGALVIVCIPYIATYGGLNFRLSPEL